MLSHLQEDGAHVSLSIFEDRCSVLDTSTCRIAMSSEYITSIYQLIVCSAFQALVAG